MSYFPAVNHISYEGAKSDNPFAFKFYNPDEIVSGKTMAEHLRFSIAYWHTFTEALSDPFGAGTAIRPWNAYTGMDLAKARVEAAFEFFEKINVPYFCFHDVDIAPEGSSLKETYANLDVIVAMIKDYMKDSNTKLLWNTANNFTHPRFVGGAASSNEADVFAYSAAKVKKGLEIGKELGAENYVFWGGREGYESLLNTDLKLEMDNLGRFFHMAVDYAKEIGFDGQFLIEPKPKEPTTHQYDFDVATGYAFLQHYGLQDSFNLILKQTMQRLQDIHLSMSCVMPVFIICLVQWTQTKETLCLVGIQMSFRQTFIRQRWRCMKFCKTADLAEVA